MGNTPLLTEKVLAITDHMADRHSFPENKHYMKCRHPATYKSKYIEADHEGNRQGRTQELEKGGATLTFFFAPPPVLGSR